MSTTLALEDDQLQDVITSLGMRLCHIETGTVILRASDALEQGKASLVKPLSESQRDTILRMEQLRGELQEAQSRQRMQPRRSTGRGQ